MATFREIANDPVSTVYYDWQESGFRCLVLRGPAHVCAYIGVKESHPFYGKDYSDLNIDCHGGLTFASNGEDDSSWPSGWWWLGWDYGHYNDASLYNIKYESLTGIEWTPEMVKREFPEVIAQFILEQEKE